MSLHFSLIVWRFPEIHKNSNYPKFEEDKISISRWWVVALSFGSIINITHCKHPEKNRHPMMNICVCWIVCELVQKKPMHFLKVIYVLQHQSQSFIFPHCLLNVLM